MATDADVTRFRMLFDGRDDAFGTGKGGWVHRSLEYADYWEHLSGHGTGLGIAPLRDDGTCSFAAIDLDEPDFELAEEMRGLLPGTTWLERSRSGNAHVWAFFAAPIEAWVPRGIMREATAAVGKQTVEVFPKQDRLLEGMVGNYINLPYHGQGRPIIYGPSPGAAWPIPSDDMPLDVFLKAAMDTRNDPADWRKRAGWLGIASPEAREAERDHEWGEQPYLHRCAEWIIANRETNPVIAGHRSVVYFNVAKMVLNTEGYDADEALDFLRSLNDASPDTAPDSELRRIVHNADRGKFTSTGCDDPLMSPYVDPDCPIVKGER